ncbi:MAG: hypothetical protein OXR67_13375 [Chloroflexota bacterium]|nr:hypothetical protein [Chloroflexota bacterium]
MEIPSGDSLYHARREFDNQMESLFWSWIHSEKDTELSDVLDKAIRSLYVLRDAAVIQRSHVEIELTFMLERMVSHAFAALTLLEKGYVAEALSTLRTIGEGCNLMLLLTSDEKELKSFLSSNHNQRDSKFSASKVRNKLKGLDQPNVLDNIVYSKMSRMFSHFSTGSVFLNSSPYGIDVMGEEYHYKNVMMSMAIWAVLILTSLRVGLRLVQYNPDEDEPAVIQLDRESTIAIEVLGARIMEQIGSVPI